MSTSHWAFLSRVPAMPCHVNNVHVCLHRLSFLSAIGVAFAMGGGLWYGKARARMQEFAATPASLGTGKAEMLPLMPVTICQMSSSNARTQIVSSFHQMCRLSSRGVQMGKDVEAVVPAGGGRGATEFTTSRRA